MNDWNTRMRTAQRIVFSTAASASAAINKEL